MVPKVASAGAPTPAREGACAPQKPRPSLLRLFVAPPFPSKKALKLAPFRCVLLH